MNPSHPLQRARQAETLLSMHPAALDCSREETIVQVLSDLVHHCAADGLDFDGLLAQGRELQRSELEACAYGDQP